MNSCVLFSCIWSDMHMFRCPLLAIPLAATCVRCYNPSHFLRVFYSCSPLMTANSIYLTVLVQRQPRLSVALVAVQLWSCLSPLEDQRIGGWSSQHALTCRLTTLREREGRGERGVNHMVDFHSSTDWQSSLLTNHMSVVEAVIDATTKY